MLTKIKITKWAVNVVGVTVLTDGATFMKIKWMKKCFMNILQMEISRITVSHNTHITQYTHTHITQYTHHITQHTHTSHNMHITQHTHTSHNIHTHITQYTHHITQHTLHHITQYTHHFVIILYWPPFGILQLTVRQTV